MHIDCCVHSTICCSPHSQIRTTSSQSDQQPCHLQDDLTMMRTEVVGCAPGIGEKSFARRGVPLCECHQRADSLVTPLRLFLTPTPTTPPHSIKHCRVIPGGVRLSFVNSRGMKATATPRAKYVHRLNSKMCSHFPPLSKPPFMPHLRHHIIKLKVIHYNPLNHLRCSS